MELREKTKIIFFNCPIYARTKFQHCIVVIGTRKNIQTNQNYKSTISESYVFEKSRTGQESNNLKVTAMAWILLLLEQRERNVRLALLWEWSTK